MRKTGVPSAADYLIASKQCEIQGLESFLAISEMSVASANLVHQLQRERGASNLFLGSSGHRFNEELESIRQGVDEELAEFDRSLQIADTDIRTLAGASRMYSRLAYAVHTLSELQVLRSKVSEQQWQVDDVTGAYSGVIQSLLGIVFETADIAVDPEIARGLVAMFNFMQGKELAGQERAAGAAGFAGPHFDTARRSHINELIDAQNRCFEIFNQFADDTSVGIWAKAQKLPEMMEFERLRQYACHPAAATGSDENMADRWFAVTTARIDAMKQVENNLGLVLKQLCAQRLEDARKRLNSNQLALDTLGEPAENFSDRFMLIRGDALLTDSPSRPQATHPESSAPGRSLMDLLQFQAQRLQQMGDELNAARNALEERKQVERAKSLLMKYRKLSEDEAHKMLRQIAMNQSRRLIDVAKSVIEMADVWRTQ